MNKFTYYGNDTIYLGHGLKDNRNKKYFNIKPNNNNTIFVLGLVVLLLIIIK